MVKGASAMPPSGEEPSSSSSGADADARRSARESFLRKLEAQQRESQKKIQNEKEEGKEENDVEEKGPPSAEGEKEPPATESANVPKEEVGGGSLTKKESTESSQDAWVPVEGGAKKSSEGESGSDGGVGVVPDEEQEAKAPPPTGHALATSIEQKVGKVVEEKKIVAAVADPKKNESSEEKVSEVEEKKPDPAPAKSDEDMRVRAYLTSVGVVPESLVVGATVVGGVSAAQSFRLEDIFDGSSLDVLRAVVAGSGGVGEEGKPPPSLIPESATTKEVLNAAAALGVSPDDVGSSAHSVGPAPAVAVAAASPVNATRSTGVASSDAAGSAVPPLSVVQASGGNFPAADVDGRPDYTRMASELTLPPSLVPPSEAASLGLSGMGARSHRTDATTAGSPPDAQQPIDEEEEEEELDMAELEPWQRALFRRLDKQDKDMRAALVRLDALGELVTEQQERIMMLGQGQVQVQQQGQVGFQGMPLSPQQQARNAQPRVSFGETPNAPQPQPQLAGQPLPQGQQQPLPRVQPRAAQPNAAQERAAARRQEPPHFIVFPLLQSLFMSIFYVPRVILGYLVSTRPIRFYRLLYTEAVRRNVFRDFDLGLLFKIVFISAIMSSRGGGGGGRKKKGDDDGFDLKGMWERHRAHVFLMIAAVVFLVQVGWAKFIYDVVVKEDLVGRVWRDEDLRDAERREGANVDAAGDNAEEGGQQQAQGADGEGRGQHQERGDPAVAAQEGAAAGGDAAAAAGDAAAPRPAAAPARPAPRARERPPQEERRNFLLDGGVVRRRPRDAAPAAGAPPVAQQQQGGEAQAAAAEGAEEDGQVEFVAEGGVLAFFNDIRYLLGSFVLSLLPMWHPREVAPRQRQVPDEGIEGRAAEHQQGQGNGPQQRGGDGEEEENNRNENDGGGN